MRGFFKTEGELTKHRQVKIGWFDQHANEALNGEQTPIEYLGTKFNIDYQVGFRFCILFGEMSFQQC